MQRRITVRRAPQQPLALLRACHARCEVRRWLLVWGMVSLIALVAHGLSTAARGAEPQAPKSKFPEFKQVEKLVYEYFGSDGREMTDLITRQDTDELFALIDKLGWKIHDPKEILALVPDEGEFFVQQLRSKRGQAFMRDIATMPLGYDRVDRISHLERGHRYVRDLVKGPDGYKLIEYMTETSWGKNMGKQLRDAPDGAHFNKPTGRIYTADQLLPVLHDSYNAEVKRRAAANAQASR